MRNYEIEDNMYRKAVELIEKKVSCLKLRFSDVRNTYFSEKYSHPILPSVPVRPQGRLWSNGMAVIPLILQI